MRAVEERINASALPGTAVLLRRAPRAAAVAADLRVELVSERDAFLALQPEWDALVERCDDQAFYRHGFLRLWLEHFAPGKPLRLLALRDASGRLSAVLPLVAERTRLYGIPVCEWAAIANDHSCRFDMIAESPAQAAYAFVRFLGQRRDWDVVRLIDVPACGRAPLLMHAARSAGIASGAWDSQHSPYAPLPTSWDAYQCSLRRRFRSSLRRRRRRLEDMGVVTVERIDGGRELMARLDEGLALEAAGWKGRAGTAIVQDPATHAFYRDLAAHAAAEGRLALWFLRLDGRAVAFDFALEHRGRLLLLKTAYDERYSTCTPGQLLLECELHDAIERGLHECDFLGGSSTAKLDWTSHTRRHAWLYLFRGARGRAVRLVKFSVVPAVKRVAARHAPAWTRIAESARVEH